ncbi:MAG: thiamine diphosphokinase [Clostridia bacterium]|nr:thiamine diphosphokinase [Clostridia bacterium]
MKGILLLNGEPYLDKINDKNAVVYCCDGAYIWAKDRVKIDKNIGDFDSLNIIPVPAPEEIYPSEKDYTDGEIALKKLIERGVDEVEIYGGFGGRSDHFLGNLHLLMLAHKRGVKCKMVSEKEEIIIASGKSELLNLNGKTVSVLPFGGDLHIIEAEGLKYSYPQKITYGECRGVSNVIINNSAHVTFAEGDCALIIINKDTV